MKFPATILFGFLLMGTASSPVHAQETDPQAVQQPDPQQVQVAPPAERKANPRVNDIRSNHSAYLNTVVSLEGTVTQYGDAPSGTTEFYYFKDDWGGLIMIRTTRNLPEVGQRYAVSGPVSFDPILNAPFISEDTRDAPGSRVVVPPLVADISSDDGSGNALILVFSIVLVALLMVGAGVWFVRSRQQRKLPNEFKGPFDLLPHIPIPGTTEVQEAMPGATTEPLPDPEQVIEDKTIKMHAPPSGTLKILPGRFKVKSGLDTINELRFYAQKGSDGQVEITFGRAVGKPYQHIQLKPHTVSSMQAKLVIAEGQYSLINFASEESNPTTVNARPLAINESTPLQDGDLIAMGEVEFEFSTN